MLNSQLPGLKAKMWIVIFINQKLRKRLPYIVFELI